MKILNKTIIYYISIVILISANSASAMRIDLTADVIGTAIDVEYDGVFETIYNDISTDPYETFTIGRVIDGNFVSERRAILEFNLASIDSTINIQSATLTMDWPSRSNLAGAIDFYGYEGSGVLDIANATKTDFIVASGSSATNPVSFDVTNYIQGYLDSEISYAGFLGVENLDGANTNFWANFTDSYEQICGPNSPPTCVNGEIIFVSSQPTLSVVYATPIPGAVLLFSSGLISLIGLSHHQRKKRNMNIL